ncbi:MBL fold metallo-hydrolase [Enhygromyxa salina]|uniref:MBL fold metallo-hydrolase n=1 Tax=Enhygromyxa salina TaxID=215803 RepID=UPI000696A73B|nr:rhodanese-like domain-containing protein [Enhygromyxa salina]
MFFRRIRSKGLAHYSYVFGDAGQAVVVDPRRDLDIYMQIAAHNDAQITHVFETHRNEDYISGAFALSRRTGAAVYHGEKLEFAYGRPTSEGDSFDIGELRLSILETPGHTDESISIVVCGPDPSKQPLAVFTGDTLFFGEVGRTDFYPDRPREVAGLLYDSIFDKLLPLGDGVTLHPGHGPGSICGGAIADRSFSTLGHERLVNPALQLDREEFIARKLAEHHYYPPYFQEMERRNLQGQPGGRLPVPKPLSPEAFADRMAAGMVALDVRSPEAIIGAMVPGSYGAPHDMISGFAGWYLDHQTPIGLIGGDAEMRADVTRQLWRLGYEQVEAYLRGGLHGWEVSGRQYENIPTLHAADLSHWLDTGVSFTLLDVRGEDELASGVLPGATNIYVGELGRRINEVPDVRPVVTFCSTGRRATIAATVLMRAGFSQVMVCLGSMQACRAVGCPIVTPAE